MTDYAYQNVLTLISRISLMKNVRWDISIITRAVFETFFGYKICLLNDIVIL